MKTIKQRHDGFLVWMVFCCCLWGLSIPSSVAQTVNSQVNPEKVTENVSPYSEVATPKTATTKNTVEVVNSTTTECAPPVSQQQSAVLTEPRDTTPDDPCQQFDRFAEQVIDKSMDNSSTISNLSNTVYVVTAIILTLTALIVLFTVLSPLLIAVLQNRQTEAMKDWVKIKTESMEKENARLELDIGEMKSDLKEWVKTETESMVLSQNRQTETLKDWVTTKTESMEKENARLKQDIEEMKKKVLEDLRYEFITELTDDLRQRIDKQTNFHGKQLIRQMDQQSLEHEERLYHVEKVHSDLLIQEKLKEATVEDLSEWILKQQEDYVELLLLISPKEEETYTALKFFQERDKLPDSFLSLLRFLNKQKRLPGNSQVIAMKIAQEKFGKPLEPED